MDAALRVVFLGTPEFAVPTLDELASHYDVVAVITQPDKPVGRSQKPVPSPVALAAQSHRLPVLKPRRIAQSLAKLKTLQPDVLVVAAYGQIIPKAVFTLAPHGAVNVHPSLLPAYRGASPIAAAIFHGDRTTGVTIMQIEEGLDSGPILARRKVAISPGDTTASLSVKLAQVGAKLMLETLPPYLAGRLKPKPQRQANATTTHLLTKQDGQIDWTKGAVSIERQVRAMHPWPGAWTTYRQTGVKILSAKASNRPSRPGSISLEKNSVLVGTGQGSLTVTTVQPAGKVAMPARDWIRGLTGSPDRFR